MTFSNRKGPPKRGPSVSGNPRSTGRRPPLAVAQRMPIDPRLAAMLGQRHTLPIVRFGTPGAFLTLYEEPATFEDGTEQTIPRVVLLPGAELAPIRAAGEEPAVGDDVDVFLYLDSEDRPVATRAKPRLMRGEVAFVTIVDSAPFGAFADWGLAKELLIPLGEQVAPLAVGDVVAVALYVDESGRLAGTTKVREHLKGVPNFAAESWVDGEAWRRDPDRGLFVILERRCIGLLPATEPHRLRKGEAAKFRIANIHRDGKVELSLRQRAHEELDGDATAILAHLQTPGSAAIGDKSEPEEIYALFRISKKAFKRASGRLFKQKKIEILEDGQLVLVADPV